MTLHWSMDVSLEICQQSLPFQHLLQILHVRLLCSQCAAKVKQLAPIRSKKPNRFISCAGVNPILHQAEVSALSAELKRAFPNTCFSKYSSSLPPADESFAPKAAEWKFGKVPVIVVTPPSFPADSEDVTLAPPPESDLANDANYGATSLLPTAACPTNAAEIGLAYSTYQKVGAMGQLTIWNAL